MDREILPRNPDLIFIEFARNSGHMQAMDVWVSMEGIVRKLWKLNPHMDVVFVYTYCRGNPQVEWDNDRMPLYESAMEQVADHYGIPSINLAYGVTGLERAGTLLCVPPSYGLISKRDRREQDWWLGWRTSCHWQTEVRDHWLEFGFNADEQKVFAQEPRRLELNAWQHLAVTRQGSLLTLYLNGTPVASQTAATAMKKPGKAPVVLGTIQFPWDTANGEEHAYKGRMDDAAIFTGALGPAAVAALATGNATPLQIAKTADGARLVAWWDFEQTTGTSLPDASGNRHEGVLKNFGDRYEKRATDAWWVEDRPTHLKHSRRALWFSGGHMKSHQGDYIEIPSLADLDLSGDFTLSLWVKPETAGVRETMFCVDGVHPIQSGHRVYTGFVAEAVRAMGHGQPVDHGPRLAKPFVADHWGDARQIELGPQYLAGTWKALDENDPAVKPWRNITGTVWASQNPGDKIHFTFRGAGFGLFDFTGPDAGQLIVTVDGVRREKLVTRFLPWSRDLGPCFAPICNDLDPAKVHDVTLEIHAEEPSRRGIWGPFDEGGMEAEIAKPKYRGKWIRASHLMIRGELVEGKTLRVVRDVDFENLPDGPPKWETGLINNTWTGDKSTISVVPTGTEFGKALEVDVSNFAQISLGGPYNIEAGKTMRLSGTISARPPVQYAIHLGRGTECLRVDGSAMEQWKRFNFIVTTGKSCPDAYLHLRVFGVGKVWLGNLRLEEFDGVMPVQPPPRLGNLLQNSSFELGMDGTWYRDNSVFVREGPRNPGRPVIDDAIAASGRRALRLEGHGMYSSSYYPVAYQQRYTLSFSARADYEGAGVYAEFIGPKAIGRGVRVPKDRWERIVLPFQIQDPEGQVLEVPAASVRIGENIPAGKHVWIDDLDLRHGEPAPYQPGSRREIALTTDQAHNRVDAGREFTVQVRAAVWGTASDVPADGLPVHLLLQDEMDKVIQEWDALLRIEQGGQQENSAAHFINLTGQVTLPQGLPSGYWRFVTRSGLDASCEGEALVSVTPRLPAETPLDWPAGNHTGPDEIDSSFGTRWVRLHDCSIATRWWRVEPAKGKWTWDASDAEIAAYRKAGFRVLGLLEGVPGWRTKSGKFGHSALEYPDRDFTDWKNYVRTMVAHYKGVIDAWEVTNEPVFAGKSFDGQENPLWYTEILKQAYQAAKEVDPKVVIVGAAGGGHVEKNDKWTAATIGAGLFSYCDVFSYHGYGRTGTILLSTTDDYFAYVDWLHEEMQKRVGRILPIWDTENGYGPRSNTRKYWLPNHEGFAPLDMARTLAVAFACERFKGVEKTFYYHGWHYRLTEPAVLMNFHDVNSQLTPLTVTLPVAIQQLYGLQPGTASRQGLATVLQFASPAAEEPRRSVWMVWTERTPQPVEIRVPARAKVSAVQVFGRPFAVQVDGDKATFQAGPWPVYVTAQ